MNIIIRLRANVIMKDRKYNFTWPFWLEMSVEDFIWKKEIDFGIVFSNQARSSNIDATFWLISRLISG